MVTIEAASKPMNMTEIREKARILGIKAGKMRKADLIHSIQIAEGCVPCFGRSDGQCGNADCSFIEDCLKVSLTEVTQPEEQVKQQSEKMAALNEQLQHEKAEHKMIQNKLKKCREQFKQHLKSVSEQLQHETAVRQQAEENLVQFQAKLDNANFVIQQYIKSEKSGHKVRKVSHPVVSDAARFFGGVCGLLYKAIPC